MAINLPMKLRKRKIPWWAIITASAIAAAGVVLSGYILPRFLARFICAVANPVDWASCVAAGAVALGMMLYGAMAAWGLGQLKMRSQLTQDLDAANGPSAAGSLEQQQQPSPLPLPHFFGGDDRGGAAISEVGSASVCDVESFYTGRR